jgi:dynein light chain 1
MLCLPSIVAAAAFLQQSGVERLGQLRVLFLSNNKIRDWTEVDRLAALERLEDLLLVSGTYFGYSDR